MSIAVAGGRACAWYGSKSGPNVPRALGRLGGGNIGGFHRRLGGALLRASQGVQRMGGGGVNKALVKPAAAPLGLPLPGVLTETGYHLPDDSPYERWEQAGRLLDQDKDAA